jgi:hypothetical protein
MKDMLKKNVRAVICGDSFAAGHYKPLFPFSFYIDML